jgi:hypothetical protein
LSRASPVPTGRATCPSRNGTTAPDGLVTVCALIEFLAENPAALGSETQPVLLELKEYERVLRKTAGHHLNWHIAVSWR